METDEKKVNMSINNGSVFYAHELSINFNPLNFIFDFKNVTPRVDPRSKEGLVLHMDHNVIITDPYHAKKISELLNKVIADYEKQFGKIEMPKALKKYEENVKKTGKSPKEKKAKSISPDYFG
ncbi:MAG: DUF3467 domain-containing protein [Candidatus Woesearchaeota archaeon]|nr:DUF3467 domain-containing protein [Candidatus Woesearchaeota archaeon]